MTDPAPNDVSLESPSPIDDSPPTPTMDAQPQQQRLPKKKAPARPQVQMRHSMNGPLYMRTSDNKVLVRRARRREETTLKSLASWLFDNQTACAFNLIALIFLTHACLPKAREHTSKFFTLTYYNPESGHYANGRNDFYFIGFCVVAFTGLRACLMDNVFSPLGKHWGLTKKKEVTRFAEQVWMLLYYAVFWPLGMYIYYYSPYYFSLRELWTDWPNREMEGLTKVYLLAQWAFWLQMVLVLHLEERRKDHLQMLTHHFVTIGLVYASYSYHHTRVGNLILVLMDVADLFLALAKCLKYLGCHTMCDAMFGCFMASWFVARHIFYPMVCYSIYRDVPEIMPIGCFRGSNANLTGPFPAPDQWTHMLEPFQDPEGLVCFNRAVQWGFLGALLGLQVLSIVWFTTIVKIAIRVLRGGSAEDVRSDDEGEEGEEIVGEDGKEEFEYEEAQPLEEEVGIEGIDLKNWERRSGIKRAATTSGVSLPGHSDRKELLGRIGCEKQVD